MLPPPVGVDNSGRKLRVVIQSLVPVDDPTSGGGIMHRAWAEALAAEGHEVVVIEANNRPNQLEGQPYPVRQIRFNGSVNNPYLQNPDAVPLYSGLREPSVPFNYPIYTQLPTSAQQFYGLSPEQLDAYVMSWAWAFRSAALVYGLPDVVWNGHAWVMNAVTAGVPTVTTVHGTDIAPDKGYRVESYRPIVAYGLTQAAHVIAISKQESDNITDPGRYGVSSEKVTIVPNGYNTDNFRPDISVSRADLVHQYADQLRGVNPNAPWIIFCGKAAYFKGVDNLMHAFAQIYAETGAQLIIIGGGDFNDVKTPSGDSIDHSALAERLGVRDAVHFMGPLPQGEVARFLTAAEVSAFPSRNEPFGLVAVESMGSGRLPILTNNGGFVDIVGNRTDVARMVEAENANSPNVIREARTDIDKNTDIPSGVRDVALALLDGRDVSPYDVNLLRIAMERVDATKMFFAKKLARESLADGLRAELKLSPQERMERGQVAAGFAISNFSGQEVIRGRMLPIVKAAAGRGRSPRFGLEYKKPNHNPLRQERLDAISMQSEVKTAFEGLSRALGTDQIGRAWQAFDVAVAHYMGRASFRHPLNMEAMPNFATAALFSEVARMAGVPTQELLSVMKAIEATPASRLVVEEVSPRVSARRAALRVLDGGVKK